ncbi:hypothetical protein JCM24511_03364 [Saitozyma sp. JCM 24511]|nr:hypothetical protein JCM24511_03364 [Saitozyma sp. JCM 24511]
MASSSKSRSQWAPSWLAIGSPSGKYEQLPTTTPPSTPQLASDREVELRVARRRRILPPIICVALLLAAVGLSFAVSSTRDIVTAGLEEVETEITGHRLDVQAGHRLDVQAGLPAAKLKGQGQVGSSTAAGVVPTGAKGAGATGTASAIMGAAATTATVTGHKDMWGLSEDDGWRSTKQGLSDLGMLGEKAYHLDLPSGEAGIIQYFDQLVNFTQSLPSVLQTPLLTSLHDHLPPSHPGLIPAPKPRHRQTPGLVAYKTILQTNATDQNASAAAAPWLEQNGRDGWELEFLDDEAADQWVSDMFNGSDVAWAWEYVGSKAPWIGMDMLRYLLLLTRGGLYSDIDTRPIRPIEQWGLRRVEVLDLTSTDGPDWRSNLTTHPGLIIGTETDVHSHPHWLESGWLRPLGMSRGTIGSAPNHPIILDAARRAVNHTRVAQKLREERIAKVVQAIAANRTAGAMPATTTMTTTMPQPVPTSLASKSAPTTPTTTAPTSTSTSMNTPSMPKRQVGEEVHEMNVEEWTGSAMFTDAVMAFLRVRYNVTWHRLRGLDHPLRIGDVLILPITAFSSGGEPDFQAGDEDDPQADVVHDATQSPQDKDKGKGKDKDKGVKTD